MTEGEYFREQLILFIENHKDDFLPGYERFIEALKDKNRRIPIRAIMHDMKGYNPSKYTAEEMELLDEAMHNYG